MKTEILLELVNKWRGWVLSPAPTSTAEDAEKEAREAGIREGYARAANDLHALIDLLGRSDES